MTEYVAYMTIMAGGCGVNVIAGFKVKPVPVTQKEKARQRRLWGYYFNENNGNKTVDQLVMSEGLGFTCGSFRDTPQCKGVFEEMCRLYPLILQTPVRKNKRHPEKTHTGSFLAVWDTNKKTKAPVPK